MGTRLSTATRNAMTDAAVDSIDAGAGAGKLRVYTSTQPATPNTAITSETLLVEFTLADPAFGSSSTGTATLAGTPLVQSGVAAGTAGWFRVVDSNDLAIYDGVASLSGGGGQLILNTLTVSVGVDVQITAGSFAMPMGS